MTQAKCDVRRFSPADIDGYSQRRQLDKKEVKP
jgi:hypothetical protein